MPLSKVTGIKGALTIQFASRYANVAIQLALTAILARLVSPSDYGLLAIVTVFTTFFSLFADMGIGPAIIQFKDLSKDDIDGLFIFSIVSGFVLLLLFVLASWPISLFYSNNNLIPLCFAIAPSVLFNTLNMVPNGVLLREKRFGAIGIRLLVASLVAGIVAVVFAALGFGVYALAINVDLQSLIVFVWSLAASGVRLRKVDFVKPLRKVFQYSSFQLGFSFVNYFSRNLDNLLIGRFVGVYGLGIYDKAYKLTTYPISYLASIIGSVLQPFMSEHQDEPDLIYIQWVKITRLLSLATVPIVAILFGCANEAVLLLYGDQWVGAVIPLRILSVSLYFQIVNNPTGAIFQSTGRTDYLFRNSLITTGITVSLLVPGLLLGSIEVIAAGVAAAYCLHTIPILYYLVHRIFQKSVPAHISVFIADVVICILASACAVALGKLTGNLLLGLIIKVSGALVVVAIGYVATGRLSFLKESLKGKKETPDEEKKS